MMGGGSDLDEAFRWLCNKGNGGDFLILRARGRDGWTLLCRPLRSLAAARSGHGGAGAADVRGLSSPRILFTRLALDSRTRELSWRSWAVPLSDLLA